MRLHNMLSRALLACAVLSLSFTAAEAAKVDPYRAMLAANRFTIRYENATPLERDRNRDIVSMDFHGKMFTASAYVNKPYTGTITSNAGNSWYEERAYDDGSAGCLLVNGDKFYRFYRFTEKGKVSYWNSDEGWGKVKRETRNTFNDITYGRVYDDPDITLALTILLPDVNKPAGSPSYYPVGSGTLSSGLSYEDFRADYNDGLAAIRYYFEGNQMVKIASASYRHDSRGVLTGTKSVLLIKEFAGTPDASLLTLPSGLKVK